MKNFLFFSLFLFSTFRFSFASWDGMQLLVNVDFYLFSLVIFFVVILCVFLVVGIVRFFSRKKSFSVVFWTKPKVRKKMVGGWPFGGGLRLKFVFFTIFILVFTIAIVAFPLYINFVRVQNHVVANNLIAETSVLLKGISSNVKPYLADKKITNVSRLVDQLPHLDYIKSVTILGEDLDGKDDGINFLWATNMDNIYDYVNGNKVILGKSKLENDFIPCVLENIDEINYNATRATFKFLKSIDKLKDRLKGLGNDKWSILKREEIENEIYELKFQMNSVLIDIANESILSYPYFEVKDGAWKNYTEYYAYTPIIYYDPHKPEQFVHGIIILEAYIESVVVSITNETERLAHYIWGISVVDFLSGIVAALLMATIIIQPIKKLVDHVAMIRDTEDKSYLSGKSINLRQKDEIGILGNTIDDMTKELVNAATLSRDLVIGREVQKMFIPLDTDYTGRKLTSGHAEYDGVEFFGYYEGARLVSGDYFDYLKLDSGFYAIIKCDVAGKGIPAALIMVEIATLFLSYFKDWNVKTDGLRINDVVASINDFIETRGFSGRFASFTICLLEESSGDLYICNAGDNIVHIFDDQSKKMKTIYLQPSAAAGVFPSSDLNEKTLFKVEKLHLNSNDILFLYTDGIEESKRFFRNKHGALLTFNEFRENKKISDNVFESAFDGKAFDEFGLDRVNEIIESVLCKKEFVLTHFDYSGEKIKSRFDFSNCLASISEVIIALVSIEKIFRVFILPSTIYSDRVKVDKKIDSFLKKYFVEYGNYNNRILPVSSEEEYVYYTNLEEDEQYDDLTILAIRKK